MNIQTAAMASESSGPAHCCTNRLAGAPATPAPDYHRFTVAGINLPSSIRKPSIFSLWQKSSDGTT